MRTRQNAGNVMSSYDPETGSRTTHTFPTAITEEANPSLRGIERRGSVRSTGKASNSRVVPTQVPPAVTRGTRRESQR